MSKNQAVAVIAVVLLAVAAMTISAVVLDSAWGAAIILALMLGLLTTVVLRVQFAVLQELRRVTTGNDRSAKDRENGFSAVSEQQRGILEELGTLRSELAAAAEWETAAEARILRAVNDAGRLRSLQHRLEEVERKVLAATEVSRLSQEDSARELQRRLSAQ